MRWSCIGTLASAASASHLHQMRPSILERQPSLHNHAVSTRQSEPKFLNQNTTKFAVNGTGIPEVDFDIGESYAGLLPIGDANENAELYFWFFPSTSEVASREILIWVTGGPGCSSTGELMQENGPFLWQPGVFKPVENKWSWHKLTNVVWVDQPVGAGFSKGNVTARDETDVAGQFLGFWKNFIDTFSMQGYKVYVTGSSYAGMYTSYIASAMLDRNDADYFNVSGLQIFDGTLSKDSLAEDITVTSFVDSWDRVFSFNDSYTANLHAAAQTCGYTDYLAKWLVFPPAGTQPSDLPGLQDDGNFIPGCDLLNSVYAAALEQNPCFSPYSIFDFCPIVYDPLGFSAGTDFVPEGSGPIYLNRPDVKAAINAPSDVDWVFCNPVPVFVNGTDNSLNGGPGAQPVLPGVIERTQNVIIAHGSQDFVLNADGTILAIQNMTWGGKQGFQSRPSSPLFIPFHSNDDVPNMAGAGVMGTTHTERGLTYFGVAQSGHFLSQDAPAVSFRSLEVLLGRVNGFQSTVAFTTDANATAQPTGALGDGTSSDPWAGFSSCSVGAINGSKSSVSSHAPTSSGPRLYLRGIRLIPVALSAIFAAAF